MLRVLRSLNLGVIGVFCIRVVSAGLAYGLFVAVGHTTNLETYNQFALLFTLINFVGPIGALASTPLVFKYWPTLTDIGKTAFVSSLARTVLVAGSLAAGAAAIFSARSIQGGALLYAITAACVLIVAFTELFFAVFRVTRAMLTGVLVRELLWRLLFISIIMAASFSGLLLSTTSVTALLLAVNLVTLTIFIAGTRTYLSLKVMVQPSVASLPPASQIATFFFLSLLSIASVHLDTLLLSVRGPSTELGAFFSSQRTIQILYFFSQSIGVFASPRVASDFASKNLSGITHQSRLAALGGLAITLPSALFLIVFSQQILGLFRPEFREFWPIIVALSIGPVVYTALGYQSIIPTYCGEERRLLLGRVIILVALIPIKLIVVLYSSLLMYSIVCSIEIVVTSLYSAFISSRYCKVPVL